MPSKVNEKLDIENRRSVLTELVVEGRIGLGLHLGRRLWALQVRR